MGLFAIFVICAYLICATLIGVIVLRAVPRLTVTIVNIVVFVAGAIAGTAGMGLLLRFAGKRFGLYPSVSEENSVALILTAAGVLIGGTTLVWIKEILLHRRRE